MRLLETRTAPSPRRVRIFLAEKGISVPVEEVEFLPETLQGAAFTRLNPMQRVPVLLLDDGTAISESVAICRYFEELQPEPALFGKGARGSAMVEMWNRRMELGLFFHVAQVFRHLHPKMAPFEVPQIAAWGEANRRKVLDMLAILDARLGEAPFIAGEDYTIADITALVAIDFMRPARIVLPEGLENIGRWHRAVSLRPSAAA